MTSRFRSSSQEITDSSDSSPSRREQTDLFNHGSSINRRDAAVPIQVDAPAVDTMSLPRVQASPPQLPLKRPLFRRRLPEVDEDDGFKKKRSFCRTWCDMWFLLAQSKISCVILSVILFGGGLLITLLTAFGGLMECSELTGAVVFLYLVASLSISLGCLCCCYHWVRDNDDLPFGIFCVAYCLLFLFICVSITGTVVVFTRIHPIGPDQPPPIANGTIVNDISKCSMVELPFGVLIICYCLAVLFLMVSYFACLLAFGARHIDDN